MNETLLPFLIIVQVDCTIMYPLTEEEQFIFSERANASNQEGQVRITVLDRIYHIQHLRTLRFALFQLVHFKALTHGLYCKVFVLLQHRNNKLKGLPVKETGAGLYDFYKKLTASDAPVKERAFMEYYMIEKTLTNEMVDYLAQVYSSGEHKAFTLRHFKALHGFNGKEFGWPDLQLDPNFQVVQVPNLILCNICLQSWLHAKALCMLLWWFAVDVLCKVAC
jgi:hypothetical protein